MSSEAKFTDHLFETREKLPCGQWAAPEPMSTAWLGQFPVELLFAFCTAIIGRVGEQKELHLTLDPHVEREEGGIFSASPTWIWTNKKRLDTVTSSRVYKAVQRKKQNRVAFFYLLQMLCRYWFPCDKSFCSSLRPAWKRLCVHRRWIHFPPDGHVNSHT